jgi:hypothetical protein
MRGVGILALILGVPFTFVGCGGKTHGDDDSGQSGAGGGGGVSAGRGGAGHAAAGAAGKSASTSGGAPGTAGTKNGGGSAGATPSGGDGNAGGEAGSPEAGRGGAAGRAGGASTMGGASGNGASGKSGAGGKAAGGTGSGVAATYAPPAMGQTWRYLSADPLNSTPPVLLAVDDDVILAGASADPTTVGVTAFDDGVMSEAFVMRMSQGKAVWSKPLKPAGLPWAMARSGGDVVIVAANLPDLSEVSVAYVSKDVYITKIGIDGTSRYEKTISFDHDDTATYGLAVDSTGAIFLAGVYEDGGAEHVILVKCDQDGNKLWEKPFDHPGTQAYANAVTVLSGGDVVVTGVFDITLSFGGGTQTLTSTAQHPGLPSGFLARFTPDGEPVWSAEFGGNDFSTGMSLAPLLDGGFLLSGADALDLHLGGKTAMGAPFTATDAQPFPPTAAFIARLDGDGNASWLVLEKDADFGSVVATDTSGTAFLGGSDVGTASGTYLRTYDLSTGAAAQVMSSASGDAQSTSLAVATSGSVWVSGRYDGQADFGNTNVLETSDAGVFLLRVDPD